MSSAVATDNSPSSRSRLGAISARPIPLTRIREFRRRTGFNSLPSATATQMESGRDCNSMPNPRPVLEIKTTRPSTLIHLDASESVIGACNDETTGGGTLSWPMVVKGISGVFKKSKLPSSEARLNEYSPSIGAEKKPLKRIPNSSACGPIIGLRFVVVTVFSGSSSEKSGKYNQLPS